MAVVASSGSVDASSEQNGRRPESKKDIKADTLPSAAGVASKRNNCPGIRVVHGRIYDSEHGKTCHQCRQKTRDFAAECKNIRKNKPCTIKFCHKCLLNRYGEKAEEVVSLENWSCPKCRGICNCSVCMKKQGHQPTGILVRTAKEGGFLSVSQMLQVKGVENICPKKDVNNMISSAQKEGTSEEDLMINLPKKRGKENSFDGKMDSNLPPLSSSQETVEKKSKKVKSEDTITKNEIGIRDKDVPLKEKHDQVDNSGDINRDGVLYSSDLEADIPLPQTMEISAVAGIELSPENVGDGLQFLEFCAVFGKILGLRKGQAEAVLRDLTQGRGSRRGKHSLTVQFHIQLLSVIQKDREEGSSRHSPTNGKDSWFHALKRCISEAPSVSEHMGMDILDSRAVEYETLDFSKKLKLLNFLCDEVLQTGIIRSWIAEQNSKFSEKAKEAKDKALAAKEEEKRLRQKMQDEVAKAIIARNGAPLSISEHESIVSQIKSEAARAHAEVLELRGMLVKSNKRSEALRTENIFLGSNGHAYWKLKCYSDKPDMLLQDVGNGDKLSSDEKWFAFDVEETEVIEKHISSLRRKRIKAQRTVERSPPQSVVAHL